MCMHVWFVGNTFKVCFLFVFVRVPKKQGSVFFFNGVDQRQLSENHTKMVGVPAFGAIVVTAHDCGSSSSRDNK